MDRDDPDCVYLNDRIAELDAQLAPSPCLRKHPMWAWRCKNCGAPESAHLREMPEPPTNEFVGHCILCEEVQAAVSAESHRCQEMYLSDMAKMREDAQAAVATALDGAAQHKPMIAITGHKKLYTWIYCSCGFNKEYVTHTTEPEAWSAHIRNLTPLSAGAQATSEREGRG